MGYEYLIHLGILVGIYLILAGSFNLSFGAARLFNLAHVAIYGIGAYTTAILSVEYQLGFFSCIVASMILSGILALLVAGISFKLSDDYFAIGTLAFSSVVTALMINWKSLTRGVLGIPGIPRPEISEIDFYSNTNFFILTMILAFLALFFIRILFKSPYGRMLQAQAEFEFGANVIGVPSKEVRALSFVFASIFSGLAGGLFAYYLNYIDPSSFALTEMVFVVTIVVVGKPGSFWGCILATVFLVLLPEPIRFVELPPGILGPMRQLLYSLILFGVVYNYRETLFPPRREV